MARRVMYRHSRIIQAYRATNASDAAVSSDIPSLMMMMRETIMWDLLCVSERVSLDGSGLSP